MACSNRFRPFVRSRVSFDAPARLALKPGPRPVFAKKKSPESGIDADFRVLLLIARTVALVITVYANYLLSVALNEKSWTDPFLTSKQRGGDSFRFRQCNGARFGRGSTRDGFPHAMARREDGRPGEASGGFREAHDDDGG